MEINGVKLEIDFTDADVLEKIESGSKKVYAEAEELRNKTDLSPAEGIRLECKILKNFLDYVLGEGTSEKLFGQRDSLKECLKAYEDIVNARETEYNEIINVVSKYSPNRIER